MKEKKKRAPQNRVLVGKFVQTWAVVVTILTLFIAPEMHFTTAFGIILLAFLLSGIARKLQGKRWSKWYIPMMLSFAQVLMHEFIHDRLVELWWNMHHTAELSDYADIYFDVFFRPSLQILDHWRWILPGAMLFVLFIKGGLVWRAHLRELRYQRDLREMIDGDDYRFDDDELITDNELRDLIVNDEPSATDENKKPARQQRL